MLADIVDRVLRDELVGERADRREWLWHRLWELDRTDEFPIWLFGVVDVALWDLEGRVLGVPVHRLLGTYRDSIPAYASTDDVRDGRGVSRRRRPVSRARLPSDQAARLGGRTRRRRPLPAAPRPRRRRRRPDVRRLGRLRPTRRGLPRPRPRGGGLSLVRGADARVQRHRVQLARRARRRSAPRGGDLGREPSQHRRLHRLRLRHLRQDECEPPRRDDRRDADRPSRRLVPAAGRSARPDRAGGAPLHVHPELHLLRVARDLQPSDPRSRVSGRTASCTRPTEPGIALPSFVAASTARARQADYTSTTQCSKSEGGRST